MPWGREFEESVMAATNESAEGGSGDHHGAGIRIDSEAVSRQGVGLPGTLPGHSNSKAMESAPRNIWVIDDDIAVLALLKSVFERAGHAVRSSGTVKDAMKDMPQASSSALVVLDFNIPGGSGLDVLRELRLLSDAPVLMISNVRRPELVAQAFDLGANDFVEKPFDPRSLAVRARRLME